MKVYSNNIAYSSKQLGFQSWQRSTRNSYKKVINRNDTCFFRDADFIPNLAKFLSEKFKDVQKVNVYNFGCSDGSEALSFVMSMLTKKEELNPQKFFPIIAKDIDPIAIQKAKNNEHKMTKIEKENVNIYTKGQYNKFIEQPYGEPHNRADGIQVVIKKEIISNVDFAEGDIFKDYKEINPQNSVVMARNFWPYVRNYQKRMKFFKDLYKHLDKGSYFIIGDYDQKSIAFNREGNLEADLVNKIGFKPTLLKYVFVK